MDFSLTDAEAAEFASILRRSHKDLLWSEEGLLSLIDRPKSKTDVYWSVIGLRHCGTRRCVPVLKTLATHPMQDIKASAILTIAQVAGSAETAYFAECLVDPKYKVKGYAMWALGVAGDATAMDAVHAYIKKRKRELSAKSSDPRTQQEVVAYFYRTLGPEGTEDILTRHYPFVLDSLVASFNSLPAMVRERFALRVPRLKHLLGTA